MTEIDSTTPVRRGAWRREHATSPSTRRMWKYTWRGVLTALATITVLWLLWLLLAPFFHAQSKVILVDAPIYRQSAPVPYFGQQQAALEELRPALHKGGGDAPVRVENLRNAGQILGLGDQLKDVITSRSDVMMLYVAAHGVSRNRRGYLMCENFEAASARSGLVPIEEVLTQLQQADAHTRVLILDSGSLDYEPNQGLLANEFPELLQKAVDNLNKAETQAGRRPVWILNSNSVFERSHLSRALQRSIFGFFVTEGLKGPADLNRNRVVTMRELHRFVATHTASWVRFITNGNETQTPMLLTNAADTEDPVLISAASFPKEKRMQIDWRGSIRSAQSGSRTFSDVLGTRDYLSTYNLYYQATSPLYRIGIGSRLESVIYRGRYAQSRLGPAAQAVQSAQPEEPAAPEGEEGGAGDGDQAADGEEGEGDKADGEGEGDEEPPKKPPFVATLARLLTEGWELRDTLVSGETGLEPAVTAPHLLHGFEQQWLAYEQQFRLGRIDNDRQMVNDLRDRVQVLRTLVTGKQSENITQQVEASVLEQWTGKRLDIGRPHSLGLMEAIARWSRTELDEATTKLVADLDRLSTDGERKEFVEWAGKLPTAVQHYSEIKLARKLAAADEIDWQMIQLAVRTRRAAERAAAVEAWCIPWVEDQIHAADRKRIGGERTLLDGIGRLSVSRAERLFQEALVDYEQVADDTAMVRKAYRRAHMLSARFPDYLRWLRRASGDTAAGTPQVRVLEPLLGHLRELRSHLAKENPSSGDVDELRRLQELTDRMQKLADAGLQPAAIEMLTSLPQESGNAWRIESLLSSPLPSSEVRNSLLLSSDLIALASNVDYKLPTVPTAPPLPAPVSAAQWERLRTQVGLERELVKVVAEGLDSAADATTEIDQAWTELETQYKRLAADPGTSDTDGLWRGYSQLGHRISQFYAGLPNHIRRVVVTGGDLSDPQQRARQVARLRAATWAMHWVRGDSPLAGANPLDIVRQVELYDMLVWHAERLQRAEAFAPPTDRSDLAEAGAAYRSRAATVASSSKQPAPPVIPQPPVELTGPKSLDLIAQSQRQFLLTVRNNGAETTNCWIVLQYDPDLVGIAEPPGQVVFRELPPESPGDEAAALVTKIIPSKQLSAGQSQVLPLRITRRGASARPSFLIAKIIGATDTSKTPMVEVTEAGAALAETIRHPIHLNRRYRRHAIALELPIPPSVRLDVAGLPGSWTPNPEGVALHPLPNQRSSFRFRLSTDSQREKKVDIQFLALAAPARVFVPSAELPGKTASQIIAQMGATNVLETLNDVTLPAGGAEVPLNFPVPPPGAGGPPPGAAAPEGEAPAADKPALPKVEIQHGLLMVITDKETGRQSLKRIDFAVQRPRRYVKAQVGYDLDSERVTIRVSPEDRNLLPPGGVKIRAEFAQPLPPGTAARLEGELKAPDFEASLYAQLPARPRETVTLWLHVDEYPRAFVYEVTSGIHAPDIAEDVGRLAVRILNPQPGAAFKAPAESIPVEFAVDAPVGSFQTGNDFVEVGFDEDRDREFADESPLRFQLDRQVKVFHAYFGPGGLLAVDSEVTDFKVDLPGRGLQNVKANLLGRMQALKQTAWSKHVAVIMDGAGPDLPRIKIDPYREVDMGKPIKVSVWDDGTGDLSGFAKVQVALDTERTGEFPAAPPPVNGVQQDNGRWEATVPTTSTGKFKVLIRVTDKVGNESDYVRFDIDVVDPTKKAAAAKTKNFNDVRGQVVHRDKPVPEAKVWLTNQEGKMLGPIEADEQGNFLFQNVPAGAYTLDANGVMNNRQLFPDPKINVNVVPQPKSVPSIRVEVVKPKPNAG